MERITFDVRVFDNFLEIIPQDGIQANSTYEIRLRGLKSADGTKELESETLTLHSRMTPSYCSVNAVLSLLDGCYISHENVMFNIREASKYANYLMRLSPNCEYVFELDEQAFEVEQFVKYKAAHDCTLKFYMEKVANSGMSGTLGEVSFDTPKSVPDISKLLSQLRRDVDKWNLALQGHKEFRAKARTGVKGVRSTTSVLDKYERENGIDRVTLQRKYVI